MFCQVFEESLVGGRRIDGAGGKSTKQWDERPIFKVVGFAKRRFYSGNNLRLQSCTVLLYSFIRYFGQEEYLLDVIVDRVNHNHCVHRHLPQRHATTSTTTTDHNRLNTNAATASNKSTAFTAREQIHTDDYPSTCDYGFDFLSMCAH